MKVLKFGGSSVATPERIQSVIEIVKPYLRGEVTIVFSAFGGVTDTLIQISTLALEGNQEYKNKLVDQQVAHDRNDRIRPGSTVDPLTRSYHTTTAASR